MATYENVINPMTGREYWAKTPGGHETLQPPEYRVMPGRPKKNRKKVPVEPIKAKPTPEGKMSRKGMIMTCGQPTSESAPNASQCSQTVSASGQAAPRPSASAPTQSTPTCFTSAPTQVTSTRSASAKTSTGKGTSARIKKTTVNAASFIPGCSASISGSGFRSENIQVLDEGGRVVAQSESRLRNSPKSKAKYLNAPRPKWFNPTRCTKNKIEGLGLYTNMKTGVVIEDPGWPTEHFKSYGGGKRKASSEGNSSAAVSDRPTDKRQMT
ncbi:hypothetical protein CCACVL1_04786 [Corchorus capsularis]|uniref:Uncharacterized protein n=1 Tax=Corchorus capsularis TaxID=210143 RepID=A0A1R3JPN7_COCAP|nr:hypothetical protein CCACVL1_04786 [Corchorus capsularis]